ncbi:MAG: PKD domain-containing protein, partial [Dehalococcoidia bacterium]|nr:PKD domain-containing protein [Dehalococcoidia bacterium]
GTTAYNITWSAGDISPVTINVTVTEGACSASCSKNVTIDEAPVAAFDASPTSGVAPLIVNFADLPTGSPTSWSWTFDDGSFSSDQNPSHQYTSASTYDVTLTVTNACGSNSTTKTNFITVSGPVPVGGEARPESKASVLAPWAALGAAIIAGATIFVRRRGAQG